MLEGLILNKKKLFILVLLSLFLVGIVMGTASAAHTIKYGKYKGTLSNSSFNKLKETYNGSGEYDQLSYCIKTKFYKKFKVHIYKNKKVKAYKWVYKYRKISVGHYYDNGDVEYDNYYPKTPKGYKKCGTYIKWNSQHTKVTNYNKYKKKVAYYKTKKVKTGKYKTVKKRIYLKVTANNCPAAYVRPYCIAPEGYHYFMGRNKYIAL